MIGRIRLGILLGALIAASFSASSASAQIAIGPGGYGLGYFNYGYNQPRIPYYALYPPVYYSYPVARTYGYSPFAYPPGTMTPELAPDRQGAAIRNPFVPQEPKPTPTADRHAAVGKVLANPFYQQAASASSASVADAADR